MSVAAAGAQKGAFSIAALLAVSFYARRPESGPIISPAVALSWTGALNGAFSIAAVLAFSIYALVPIWCNLQTCHYLLTGALNGAFSIAAAWLQYGDAGCFTRILWSLGMFGNDFDLQY